MNFACIFIHFGAVCRCLHMTNSPKIYKERRQSYSLKFAHFNKDATYHSGECCIAAGGVRSYKYFGGMLHRSRRRPKLQHRRDLPFEVGEQSEVGALEVTTKHTIRRPKLHTPPCPSYNLSDSLVSRLPCVS